MLMLRSLIYSLGMWLVTLVFAPLAMLTFPFPLKTRYAFIRNWARFNIWWLGVTCRLYYELDGRENLPQGTAIAFCKHQSAWETFALQEILPPQVWLLKRELLWVPFFGWGLAMLRPIAIDRSSGRRAVKQLVDQGRQRLNDGMWVVIYPEGTRTAPGKRGRYAQGGAMLAEHSGYPVVPIAHNAGEYWGRRQFKKRPGTIRISIGPLIETKGRKASEINAEAEAWIEGRMREISSLPDLYME